MVSGKGLPIYMKGIRKENLFFKIGVWKGQDLDLSVEPSRIKRGLAIENKEPSDYFTGVVKSLFTCSCHRL